jgi:hypothetical protein
VHDAKFPTRDVKLAGVGEVLRVQDVMQIRKMEA